MSGHVTGDLCPRCGRALMELDRNINQCFRCGSPLPSLQEVLKEAAMTVHLKHPHASLTIGPFDSCEHALCTRYRNALSPTQETDPE